MSRLSIARATLRCLAELSVFNDQHRHRAGLRYAPAGASKHPAQDSPRPPIAYDDQIDTLIPCSLDDVDVGMTLFQDGFHLQTLVVSPKLILGSLEQILETLTCVLYELRIVRARKKGACMML